MDHYSKCRPVGNLHLLGILWPSDNNSDCHTVGREGKGGRTDTDIDNFDSNAGIDIRSILAQFEILCVL